MRLLTLCVLALIVCAFPAAANETAAATPAAAETARYYSSYDYYLQAWDGKSDPTTNPQFKLVGKNKFIIENQHCFKGMEFTIKILDQSGNSPKWYNPSLCPVTPGTISRGSQRLPFQVAENWKIQEDGDYDFILMDADGVYSYTPPVYLVVQKHDRPDTAWSVNLMTNSTDEDESAPTSFTLADPVKGVHHHWNPMDPYSSDFNHTTILTQKTGSELNSYGFIPDDNNSFSDYNNDKFIKPLTVVDMVQINENNSAIDFKYPEKQALLLFNPAEKKALLYTTLQSEDATELYDMSVFFVKGREVGSDTWTFSQKMYYDNQYFPGRLNAVVLDAPENFEFYIETRAFGYDPDTNLPSITKLPNTDFDIRPASDNAAGVTLVKNVPVDALPETFGGQGTFRIDNGKSFMICLDPASMTVRAYHPDGNPFGIMGCPQDLYIVGDMKITDNNGNKVNINKPTTLDPRLKLEKEGDPYKFKITLDVYDDSYFRLSTPDDAVKGWWGYQGYVNEGDTGTGISTQTCEAYVRGNWSPQTHNDIDVPLTINKDRALGTYFQTNPGEGPRFHLPKGQYDLYVEYLPPMELGEMGGPNCFRVYARPSTLENQAIYYLTVTDINSKNSTSYRMEGDGSKLSCTFYSGLSEESYYQPQKEFLIYKFAPDIFASVLKVNNSGNIIEPYQVFNITEEELKTEGIPVSIPVSPECNFAREGFFKFELDLSDPDNIKGMIVEPVEANMPLKAEDFKDEAGNAKPHYFFVGSRTGDFRLLPEWELTPENGYKIENRLMYPGMFGIAKVDSYDDYIHHRFDFYITWEGTGLDQVVNSVRSYMLGMDPYTNGRKSTAITDYGHYSLSEDMHEYTQWPYYVVSTLYGGGFEDSFREARWWHFCEFPTDTSDETGQPTNKNLSEAFKKGTPSLATFHIEIGDDGNPANFVIDQVTTWQQNKQAILDEVNFMLCGTDIKNESRNPDGTLMIDPARNPLNGYTNVYDWANTWIQYDQESGKPYVDAYGKYLPMSVYQDSWMKDHPVLFYREADDYHYTSNDLILKPLKEIEAEAAANPAAADKFLQYYRDMKDLKDQMLGDGTNKRHAEGATFKYDFYDRVGEPDADTYMKYRKGNIPTPEGGWQPYVLSDLSLGGIFKVWSGYGGGHAGYGAWRDDIVPGDGYAWFNLNVGHYMARNPMRVDAQELERKASASDETPYPDDKMVDFYITGMDDPAADFMTIPDEDGVFTNKDIKRLILWLNPSDRTDIYDNRTSGMAKSYVQLVVSDLSPVIRAYFGEAPRSICYAWHLRSENVMEDKQIEKAVVSVFRNNVLIKTIEQTEAAGLMASACTAEDMFKGQLNDQLPGEYWFRVDVTYTDKAEKDAGSNHLTLFPEMVPADISALQRTAPVTIRLQDGSEVEKTAFGFSIDGTVGISDANANKEFISYPVSETEVKWLYMKDLIAGFEVTANGDLLPDSDNDPANGNIPYTPGQTTPFNRLLSGETEITFTARPILKSGVIVPAEETFDNKAVVLTEDLLQRFVMPETSALVKVIVPKPEYENFTSEIKKEEVENPMTYQAGTDHPGHHEIAPVYYHTVNNLSLTPEWSNAVLLNGEGNQAESVTYIAYNSSGTTEDLRFTAGIDTPADYTDFLTPINYIDASNSNNIRQYANYKSACTARAASAYITLTAIYSRDGKEIYRATQEKSVYPDFKIYGPDNVPTGAYGASTIFRFTADDIQSVVSDIITSGKTTRRVYDIRIPLYNNNRGLCTDDTERFPEHIAIYGGFETAKYSSTALTKCGHTNSSSEYGTYPQPVPFVPATTDYEGIDWAGLANYSPWFERSSGDLWSIGSHDWSSRIVKEQFAVEVPHVYCETDNKGLKTNQFYLNCYLVYPFLMKTESNRAMTTAAATATAAASPSTIRLHKVYVQAYVPALTKNNVVTGIDAVEADGDAADARRDVCTPAGVVLLRDVTLEEAEKTLSPGVYLFGTEKIVIK